MDRTIERKIKEDIRRAGKGSITSRSQTIGSYGEGRGEITIRGQLNFPAASRYEKLFVSSNLFRLATNGKTSAELCKCTARNSSAKYRARTTRSHVLSLSNVSLPFSTHPSSITGVSYIPVRAWKLLKFRSQSRAHAAAYGFKEPFPRSSSSRPNATIVLLAGPPRDIPRLVSFACVRLLNRVIHV